MPYSLLITRSFWIAWRHRYLWLLAFLGGHAVGGSGGGGIAGRGGPSNRSGEALNHLIAANLGAIVTLGLSLVMLAVVVFFVSCAATPALIRSAAEHDAERPWSHRAAWRAGWLRFGPILRLKLLVLLYLLMAVASVVALVVKAVLSFTVHAVGTGVVFTILAIAWVIALVLISMVLGIAYTLALRVITLELTGAWAGLGRGLALLRRSPGRVLLVWLLGVGLGIAAGAAVGAIGIALVSVPGSIATTAFLAGDLATAGSAFLVAMILALGVAAIAGGAGGAYLSTYWTLAYRRLDWD